MKKTTGLLLVFLCLLLPMYSLADTQYPGVTLVKYTSSLEESLALNVEQFKAPVVVTVPLGEGSEALYFQNVGETLKAVAVGTLDQKKVSYVVAMLKDSGSDPDNLMNLCACFASLSTAEKIVDRYQDFLSMFKTLQSNGTGNGDSRAELGDYVMTYYVTTAGGEPARVFIAVCKDEPDMFQILFDGFPSLRE